jgi:hypothetical protein
VNANEFADYAARITGRATVIDGEPEPAGPHDHDTCPDPLDPAKPIHTWVSRSYEPRDHCNCGTLRYPDPNKPCRYQP